MGVSKVQDLLHSRGASCTPVLTIFKYIELSVRDSKHEYITVMTKDEHSKGGELFRI